MLSVIQPIEDAVNAYFKTSDKAATNFNQTPPFCILGNMSRMTSNFQFSLELSNIFPIGSIVRHLSGSAYEQIMSFARELRKSGSDLLVEEDLAAIFGRARITREVEDVFKKDVLRDTAIVPIHEDSNSSLVLSVGSGPTVNRAITSKDRFYISTVIQLSLLGWVHGRASLASAITESMRRRYELNVEGATTDPSYEGVVGTLEACSSQTSSMNWNDYLQFVENRIQRTYPAYRHQEDYIILAPSTILASMDYLCMVQKWPESRKMTISSQRGLLTLIVWAHHLLGLSILIKGVPGGDIHFLNAEKRSPQLIIIWSLERDTPHLFQKDTPNVCLLDSEMEVILRTSSEDIELRELDACERLTLGKFGTVLLRREFSTTSSDESPVVLSAVQLVMAMAIIIVKKLGRSKDPSKTVGKPSAHIFPYVHTFSLVGVWNLHSSVASTVYLARCMLHCRVLACYSLDIIPLGSLKCK